jgi:Uma2 family endonuclease
MSVAQKKKTTRIRLNRSSNGMLMTPEEFDAVADYDDRFVYELILGVLIVVPPAGEAERDPNGELEYLLRHYRASHPQGSVLDKTLSGSDPSDFQYERLIREIRQNGKNSKPARSHRACFWGCWRGSALIITAID